MRIKKHYLFPLLLITSIMYAQNFQKKTFCNPVDVDYKYRKPIPEKRSNYPEHNVICRSSADPVLLNHSVNGEFSSYYLFATKSGGYWKSDDLISWEHILPNIWPSSYTSKDKENRPIAPAALSVNDTIYFQPSSHFVAAPIYYSTQPEKGIFKVYNKSLRFPKDLNPPGLWDPAFFYDEDLNKWYSYWGSSNVYPIVGAEMDKKDSLHIIPKYTNLINLNPKSHGWERFGKDHRDEHKPSYIEGAWMTKHNNKYFLQYGAPGTSENMYANGVYTSNSPLGPFNYEPSNPISYKPGGFLNGAGHGNTFQDKYGNWWNTGTSWIGVNWVFERRILMVPAGFDKDNQMYANTRFADFPQYAPTRKRNNRNELFTGWMLLSYKKKAIASSEKSKQLGAVNITDENPRTFWVAKENKKGQNVIIDLEKLYSVKAFQINYSDYLEENTNLSFKISMDKQSLETYKKKVYTHFKMYASKDGKHWNKIGDNTHEMTNRANPYVELPKTEVTRFIKFENIHVATTNLAISDIRIFGNGNGENPETPKNLNVVRDENDGRNAFISWSQVSDATGYNILWGIEKDKLYQTYQVWADTSPNLEIRALNLGQEYYFKIEAFSENGVSELSKIKHIQ